MQAKAKSKDGAEANKFWQWLAAAFSEWRGVLAWIFGIATLLLMSTVVAYGSVDRGTSGDFGHRVFALSVAIDIIVFALVILFFFFFVFRGADATKNALENVITYCYAFIAFALIASILPFVILPHVPAAVEMMRFSPIGIVKGCSVLPSLAKVDAVPAELRCGAQTNQWVVNIGGQIVEPSERSGVPEQAACIDEPNLNTAGGCNTTGTPKVLYASLTAAGPMKKPLDAKSLPPVEIQGGLVVPLYVVVLALMGATVSMTRRVPEFQRRMTPGDPEFMSFDSARESMVFQIMQVASAPLIAVTSYYVVDPGSRASTIVLAFASGFSSETILLFIRAALEKIRPNVQSDATKWTHVRASPDRLDFGDVIVGTTVTKSVAITNPTTIDLNLTSTNCSGEFATPANFPQRVPAGSSVTVAVSFSPISANSKAGVLTITDNAVGSPRSIDLSGNGVAANLAPTPSTFSTGTAGPASLAEPGQSNSPEATAAQFTFGSQLPQNEND